MSKRVNGSKKGGSYEREISKRLSLWLSGGERDDLFWRTDGSGGRFKSRFKKGMILEGQDGDIASTSEISKSFRDIFSLELKSYKDINIWGLITSGKVGILDFWKQARDQADSVNKIPILIMKENYKPELFVSDERTNNLLSDYFNLFYTIKANIDNEIIYIWKLKDIFSLDHITFNMILDKILESRRNE